MFVVGKPSCRSAQAERPRRRDERNRAPAGVPAFAGTTANIYFVVPANAGTHNHRCLLLESRRAAALELKGRGVWVPAFAGTTANLLPLHPREPASRDPVYRGNQLRAKASRGASRRQRLLLCQSLRRSSPRLCRIL